MLTSDEEIVVLAVVDGVEHLEEVPQVEAA